MVEQQRLRGCGAAGGSELHADPLFAWPDGGDYHLKTGSPLINQASLVPWLATAFEGDARRINCFVDVGAGEFTDGEDRRSVYLPLVLTSY